MKVRANYRAMRQGVSLARLSAAIYLFYIGSARCVSLLSVLLAIHFGGIAEFGLFSFLQASALSLSMLCSLSLNTSLQAVHAKIDYEYSAHAGYLAICVGGVTGMISFILAFLGNYAVGAEALSIKAASGVALCAGGNTTLIVAQGYYLLVNRRSISALIILSAALIQVSMFAILRPATAEMMIFIAGASQSIVALAFSINIFAKYRVSFVNFRQFVINDAFAIWGYGFRSTFSQALAHIGLWLLQFHLTSAVGASEQGKYSVGVQIFNLVIFLPTALNPLLVKGLSNRENVPIAYILKLVIGWSLICIFLIIILTFLVYVYIDYLPAAYIGAVSVIYIALLGSFFVMVRVPLSALFVARLRALPELASNALLLLICALIGTSSLNNSGESATCIRAIVSAVQLICSGIFAVAYFKDYGRCDKYPK